MNNRPNILIVDDDQDTRHLVSQLLELEGYDVTTASNGDIALTLMDKYDPNLVILDVMMPDLDGFQLLDLIRRHSDIPVIMLTVEDDVASIEKALCLGADDYVKKPFSTRVLKARIEAKLRRAKKHDSTAKV